MNAVELREVTLALGERVILNRVGLSIAPGRFVAVLGPNGAGKTTLMRALLGVLAPSRGEIRLFGAPPRRGDDAVGYMPQLRSGVGDLPLSGWEFVASVVSGQHPGLALRGRHVAAEVERVLELVGAGGLARRRLSRMSGGERQRLLIAQALIGRPRLLLLDEPLISLDPAHAQAMVALVGRLSREHGITVLFSAHELTPLLGAIDQVLYLGGGQAALGTVDEVITAPVLSRLYGAPIEVARVNGRIFVMSGGEDVQGGHVRI